MGVCSGRDYSESKKSIPVQVLDSCDLVIGIEYFGIGIAHH